MNQPLAEAILALVGPGRILHYGADDATLLGALLQRGCDAHVWMHAEQPGPALRDGRLSVGPRPQLDTDFDTVVVNGLACGNVEQLERSLAMLRTLTRRNLLIVSGSATTLPADNVAIEDLVISAGFRRHPAAFPVGRYARLNDPAREPFLCFEKLSDELLARWPMAKLLENRDLHMDMSRETGPRSDAHLVRYAIAAEYVRPGDTVLDCACGLGYGSALLAAASRGVRYIGVDIDAGSIAYARDIFSGYPVEYRAASAMQLDFLPDHTVDVVVSFETIEHLPEFEPFFDEIARVLKPDGRVIGSVPHLWVDETGRDPNPHHFHAFDYQRIRAAFEQHFTIEARIAQTAPGGVKLLDAPRQLEQRPLQLAAEEADTEWWIIIAAADPSRCRAVPYSHPEFAPCTAGTRPRLTDFAAHYDNPWIYRQLIQNGQRVRDQDVLEKLLAAAAALSPPGSADTGGILTVRAYRQLLEGDTAGHPTLLEAIDRYLDQPADNPHVLRWQISLSYVAALLALDSGQRDRGAAYLHRVVAADPLRFSPLITTKLIGAHFILGTMALVDRRADTARLAYQAGIEAGRRALHAPDADAIGDSTRPLAFGFFELAEIADMAGQCAMALDLADSFAYRPAIFWRCVDAKRFGLFTWIKALEAEHRREIDRLTEANEAIRRQSTVRILLPLRLREVMLTILPALLRNAWQRLCIAAGAVRSRRSD